MPKLKNAISFETTFGTYVVDELIGEGGAGRVFGGVDHDRSPIALKILANARASTDKRRRFKNEIAFLSQNKHANIVAVIDHGIARSGEIDGPFYVMRRYDSNLRDIIKVGIQPDAVLALFLQMLDGVEAAHLKNVVHRDLKPENILHDKKSGTLAIADFGIARFTEDILATVVETGPNQRLANFQYAAPEQRTAGQQVGVTADIYALGLMLNEMFTGVVPHGTQFRTISQVSGEMAFLDAIVSKMLSQSPTDRPSSISELKQLIQKHRAEAVSLQKISQIDGTVVKTSDVDSPLALNSPRLINADWNRGHLTLTLDRPVTPEWVQALQRMGSYSSVMGKPPQVFSFNETRATVQASEHEVQAIIDNFKMWLPQASSVLKAQLQAQAQKQEADARESLRREKQAEEQRLRVMQKIRI
jgi:serine/threonine protein kinase